MAAAVVVPIYSMASSPKFSAKISSSAILSASAHRLRLQTLLSRAGSKNSSGCMLDEANVVSAALGGENVSRRVAMNLSGASLGAFLLFTGLSPTEGVSATEYTDMPALRGKDYGKSKMSYPDYVQTSSGLQYKDLREGVGPSPQEGDQVVVDWAGYTIGYYGRIFEARNKAKGGSFESNDGDYFKFKLGGDQVIPAFEEAIKTMRVGGVRRENQFKLVDLTSQECSGVGRIIVPSDIGYPNNDYNSKGPKPATFSGQRALDFVLRNQGLIDKTLLFDIELLRVVEK